MVQQRLVSHMSLSCQETTLPGVREPQHGYVLALEDSCYSTHSFPVRIIWQVLAAAARTDYFIGTDLP